LKDSGLIENEFSLTFKNGSLNETKKIEDLSPVKNKHKNYYDCNFRKAR
jgi:hypothetical protein